jgi:hypothetical protein
MKSKLMNMCLILGLLFPVISNAGVHHRHFVTKHNHSHWHHRHHWHHNHGWIAPAIIGGAVTYAITRPYVEQPIIIQQPQPQVVECTEWKEVLHPNGQVVQERTCTQR